MINTVTVGSIPRDTVEHYGKVFSYGDNLEKLHLTRVSISRVLIVARYSDGHVEVATSYNMGRLDMLYTGRDGKSVEKAIIQSLGMKG